MEAEETTNESRGLVGGFLGWWKPRKGSFWMHLCISEFERHESTLTSSDFRFSAIEWMMSMIE